jgi:hypothetical protein
VNIPFRDGCEYRVRRDYSFLNHNFRAGERVKFSASAYAPKDGVTRYWFKSLESGETNAWHVFDNEVGETALSDLFEEI